MSPIHLNAPKPQASTVMSKVRQYSQMDFLRGVSADWLVPVVTIVMLGVVAGLMMV